MKPTAKIIEFRNKIYLYYSNKRNVLRLPTGISIEDQHIKENKDFINKKFNRLNFILAEYKNTSDQMDYPPIDYIKEKFKMIIGDINDLESLYDMFMENRRQKCQPETLKFWTHTFKKYLFEFDKKYKPNWNLIDKRFLKNLIEYIGSSGNLDNFNIDILKFFKFFINYLIKNKYIKYYELTNEDWKEDHNFIAKGADLEAFTEKEVAFLVDKLYNDKTEYKNKPLDYAIKMRRLKKSNKPIPDKLIFHNTINSRALNSHRKALDMLLFSCFTSLRLSDVIRVNKNMIKDNILTITLQKTKKTVHIHLCDIANFILERNKYNLHLFKERHAYNGAIKSVLKRYSEEMPSFGEDITRYEYRGGKEVTITKKRYEWFSSHAGRRSFVMMNYENGVPLNIIMEYTGHTGLQVINGYIKKHSLKTNIGLIMNDRINKMLQKSE